MKIDLLWILSWIVYFLKKNFITFEGFLCLIRLLMRKSATPQEIVTPEQALEWCQNFLRGAWSSITVEQMRLERVSYVYFNGILVSFIHNAFQWWPIELFVLLFTAGRCRISEL